MKLFHNYALGWKLILKTQKFRDILLTSTGHQDRCLNPHRRKAHCAVASCSQVADLTDPVVKPVPLQSLGQLLCSSYQSKPFCWHKTLLSEKITTCMVLFALNIA